LRVVCYIGWIRYSTKYLYLAWKLLLYRKVRALH
jgi:hypothetical protein